MEVSKPTAEPLHMDLSEYKKNITMYFLFSTFKNLMKEKKNIFGYFSILFKVFLFSLINIITGKKKTNHPFPLKIKCTHFPI